MNNWKNRIYYDDHIKENKIQTIKDFPITIKIIGLKNENCESSNLLMEKVGFKTLLDRDIKILSMNLNSLIVLDGRYPYQIPLKNFNFELKIQQEVIELDELIKEFQIKNIPEDIEILRITRVRNGGFFQYGKDVLKDYYFGNNENYEKFKNLIVDNQFSFPVENEELKDLFEFIEKNSPEVKQFLIDNIPNKIEREKIIKKE